MKNQSDKGSGSIDPKEKLKLQIQNAAKQIFTEINSD